MERIILARRKLSEDSLILQTLNPAGLIEKYKIPGILKSKKRNSFFMTPATLWDFTIAGNPREIMTPKEYTLITAPYTTDVSYHELEMLSELIKPLLVMGVLSYPPESFLLLKKTLQAWKKLETPERELQLNRYYLDFLDLLGLLHYSESCIECQAVLRRDSLYLLAAGSLCSRCAGSLQYSKAESLPQEWVQDSLQGKASHPESMAQPRREKMLQFLKTMT